MTWTDGSWDTIKLDGSLLPGRVAALDITPERAIERSQKPKTDGPKPKDQGYKGASIVLTHEVWRAADANALAEILYRLSPMQEGALQNPFAIEHPIAAIANVTKAYIEKIKFPMPVKGRWKVVINMFQWFDKPKDTKQGKGVGVGGVNDLGEFDIPPEEWVPTGTPEEIQQQLDDINEAANNIYPDPVGQGAEDTQ